MMTDDDWQCWSAELTQTSAQKPLTRHEIAAAMAAVHESWYSPEMHCRVISAEMAAGNESWYSPDLSCLVYSRFNLYCPEILIFTSETPFSFLFASSPAA